MDTVRILRILGVGLATYLFVRSMGMPWGLIAGVALALIVLP
jgi:hypothetical protein